MSTESMTAPVAARRVRRRTARRDLLTTVSYAWLGLATVVALTAPYLGLDATSGDLDNIATGPSADHLLGTDQMGRDILARLLLGAHYTFLVVVGAVLMSCVIGVACGLLAGYLRGATDLGIGILADSVLAFPTLVLVMALVTIRGPSMKVLIIGLGLAMAPTFLRLTRAGTLTYRARDFVTASTVLGTPTPRIIVRDILPNVLPGILAYSFVIMGVVTIAEGSLSYLGFGIPSPLPSWGNMIAEGRPSMFASPHIVLIPAVTLFLTVLSLNVVGEHLQRRNHVEKVTVAP